MKKGTLIKLLQEKYYILHGSLDMNERVEAFYIYRLVKSVSVVNTSWFRLGTINSSIVLTQLDVDYLNIFISKNKDYADNDNK